MKTLTVASVALAIATSASARPLNYRPAVLPQFVSPVPEPASWALMLMGAFGVGIALRRRSHASA